MEEYRKDEPATIRELFGSIAERYDATNTLLSLGIHHYWNRCLVKELEEVRVGPLLDLCCGTGEISWRYLKRRKGAMSAYLVDFCPEMIALAQKRSAKVRLQQKHDLHFIVGDAQALPLPDRCMGMASMAYGIRNIGDRARCLSEALRVLKPGGTLTILELTRPRQRWLRWGHHLYLNHLLPWMGKVSTLNQSAYTYLSKSITEFIEPEHLVEEMAAAQFIDIKAKPLMGGIAHLFCGRAPTKKGAAL